MKTLSVLTVSLLAVASLATTSCTTTEEVVIVAPAKKTYKPKPKPKPKPSTPSQTGVVWEYDQ